MNSMCDYYSINVHISSTIVINCGSFTCEFKLELKKYICKFKNQKDLERGKIKILLRFTQTRETLAIHAN